jgi:uncharacterized protein with PIN domain
MATQSKAADKNFTFRSARINALAAIVPDEGFGGKTQERYERKPKDNVEMPTQAKRRLECATRMKKRSSRLARRHCENHLKMYQTAITAMAYPPAKLGIVASKSTAADRFEGDQRI